MNYYAITNQYSVYSNLLSSTYGGSMGGISSASSADSLMGMYSQIIGYGKNTASSSVQSSTGGDYAVSIKEKASNLLDAIDKINQKGDKSLFYNNVSAVSDSDAVSVSYSDSKEGKEHTISVEQLARAQKNEGTALKSGISELYYSKPSQINITNAEGKSVSINVNIGVTDTNKKIMNNIADKINKAGLGISAEVKNNEKDGTSRLVLSSTGTGTKNSFNVSGDLAEALGINSVVQSAQDAEYTIDGNKKTSSSNNIDLGDGLKAVLNDVTKKDVKITYKEDNLKAVNAARELVNSFNALASAAYSHDGTSTTGLGNQLKNVAKTYSSALNRVGISLNSKGYLEIDEDKMDKAADNGSLARFFNADKSGTANYGFTYRLQSIASRVEKNPTSYLSSTEKKNTIDTDSFQSSYSNFSSNKRISRNYISSYYRYSSAAMLFDTMF